MSSNAQQNTTSGAGTQDVRLYAHSKDADPHAGDRSGANADSTSASSIADNVMESAKGLYDQVKDAGEAATRQTSQAVEAGKRFVEESGAQAMGQVGKRPVESVLLAGAVGLIVGLLLAR